MAEWDYSEPIGPGLGWDASPDYGWGGYDAPIGPGLGWDTGGYPTGSFLESPAYGAFTGWGDPTGPGSSGDTSFSGEGSGGLMSILASLGPGALTALRGLVGGGEGGGGLADWLGPLIAGAGGIAGGAIGSNAANEAARLQAAAANRGIDLQTSQWLQQQQNLAPYLQAGQQGLSQLQQLAGREQPGLPGQMASIDPRQYGMPGATPTWAPAQYRGPGAVQAGDYQWNPQQGPQAADYRYTPGQTPDAAAYQWTPGQAPAAAQHRYTPGAVPTLSGQELLANDPGVQFRMDEGRKALEASAAARGGLLSGPTLAALQRQGQELGSQEYGAAWNRASQQAQLREQWGQAASQMGFGQAAEEARLREGWAQQASQQGFGQAEAASRLREQVNQIASQQGWSQAQAEAAFREQMAQQASAQHWGQALQGQGQEWTQGFQMEQDRQRQQQQFDETYYNRLMGQRGQILGLDQARNETDYTRQQNAYKQQLAQYLLPWEQQSTLAKLGGEAVGMYGQQSQSASTAIANLMNQQGAAQAGGTTGGANSWLNALQNVNTGIQGGLQNQQYQQGLRSILSGLNA